MRKQKAQTIKATVGQIVRERGQEFSKRMYRRAKKAYNALTRQEKAKV